MSNEPDIPAIMETIERVDDMLYESGLDACDALSVLGALVANIISQAPEVGLALKLRDQFSRGVAESINDRISGVVSDPRYH